MKQGLQLPVRIVIQRALQSATSENERISAPNVVTRCRAHHTQPFWLLDWYSGHLPAKVKTLLGILDSKSKE